MFSRLILLLPGTLYYDYFNDFFETDDYIIAVDGGIEHSRFLGVVPHLWVGDFDSCEPSSREIFKEVPTEEYSTDKAYLDTELALLKAKELNITQCVMMGGIGGRLDHQFGLFMLLTSHPHINFLHTDGETELYSLNDAMALALNERSPKYLSIIPITPLHGVTITGVRWELHNAHLQPGRGYSLSNEFINDTVNYSQEKGLGWMVISP